METSGRQYDRLASQERFAMRDGLKGRIRGGLSGRNTGKQRERAAFSLVELLIVVAIVAILVSGMVSVAHYAIHRAREVAGVK